MLRRRALAILFAIGLTPSATNAQEAARSVVAELLDGIFADINDLRYDEAIARARTLTRQERTLADADRVRLHLLLAAAFYPAERPLQRPDSARRHLLEAVRLAPDVTYPADLRWRGLDSLLTVTKFSTLAAALRAPPRQPIGGPGAAATVTALASAPSDLELVLSARSTGEIVRRERVVATSTVFRLSLHDGQRAVLLPGSYDALLIVRRDGVRDSALVSYAITVEAPPLALEAEPTLDESRLRPESRAPNRGRTLRSAAFAAALTASTAVIGRVDTDLRDRYTPDPRAYVVGFAIGAVVAAFAVRPRVRPIPSAIAANAVMRAAHQRVLLDVRRRNADRLVHHAGEMVFRTEER